MKIGVLALQGDFREHVATLTQAGATGREVRTPADLDEVEGLVLPGGESTTIAKLAHSAGLVEPVRGRIEAGMPALGTCAGMIALASEVLDGEPLFASVDVTVRRNAYGRQVESFETDLDVEGVAHPVRGVFIRAPWVERVGTHVHVLATHEDRPVVLEQGNVVVASFHPELVGETGLHAYWLEKV
ncbi:MAG: pyridoxal 5'-phosphate synthase glutaminase subunit PdxT [Actinomycetota bacterium]